MRASIALLLVLGLSACSRQGSEPIRPATQVALFKPPAKANSDDAGEKRSPAPEAAADQAAAASAAAGEAAVMTPQGHPVAARVPVAGSPALAYSYSVSIAVPSGGVRALMARHEAACLAAGPALCQVTGSELSEPKTAGAENSGTLSLRAEPHWLKRFRDGLEGDARAANGRVTGSSTTSEDLSRQIVDTDAALKAKTALRDRLQALLNTHPGKLSDLLEVERALADVQGEIDSANSELADMRGRVTTSDLTLSYGSGLTAPGVWSPLSGAFGSFFSIMSTTLAVMVQMVAWVLPWALVIGLVVWLVRSKRLRWQFGRKRTPK